MLYINIGLSELLRALVLFIFIALGMEFLKEGLVSNVLDLNKVIFATVGLYGVQLVLKYYEHHHLRQQEF